VFDMFFCVYFCMFPVCPLCCFILISMDLESEINDDDDDDKVVFLIRLQTLQYLACDKNYSVIS